MTVNNVTTIACDESGSEGETLMRAFGPVFIHASVSIGIDEASGIMAQLRADTGTRALEIKSSQMLKPGNRQALLSAIEAVSNRGNIYILEKRFFVTAKLVHLLVGVEAMEHDVDIASLGIGRQITQDLYDHAPQSVGEVTWEAVLGAFNDLVRTYARAGAIAPTTEPFFASVEAALHASTDGRVTQALEWVWDSRHRAFAHEGARASALREMDPIPGTLNHVSTTWRMRLGAIPFEFLHDRYGALDEATVDLIMEESRLPMHLGPVDLPRGDLRGIRLVDSRSDDRIQVADILGGVGREISRLASIGQFDDDLQIAVSEMLDAGGMWSTSSHLDTLFERRPPRYADEWFPR